MREVINKTRVYSELSQEEEESIKSRWSFLMGESRLRWKAATDSDIVNSNPLDEAEMAELHFALLELNVHEEGGNDDIDQLNDLDVDGMELEEVDQGDEMEGHGDDDRMNEVD